MSHCTFPRFAPLRRSAFLLLALAAVASPVLAADPDPEAEWREFMAKADVKAVYEAYDLALESGGGSEGAEPERCRKNAQGLASAVALAPLSATVLNAAYRCAEALGDEEAAEKYAMRFAAIARRALSNEHRDWTSRPTRVVGSSDIYAMLRASGLELRYEWLDYYTQPRHLVTHVAMWDPEAKRERHFAFDYLDVVMALNRGEANAVYPATRRNYARSIVRDLSNNSAVMGADMLATLEAWSTEGTKEKAARLRPAAEIGGQVSSRQWLNLCLAQPFEGCGEGVVDALLPQVEKGLGLPTVTLALAYAQGVGVEKDEAAAMQLLDKAGAIMGPSQAAVDFGRDYAGGDDKDYPAGLRSRLEALAAKDDPYAWAMLAGKTMQLADDSRMSKEQAAALRRHADAGVTVAARLLAADLYQGKQYADAVPLLRQAAEAGDASSQAMLAELLQGEPSVPRDEAQAQRWRLEAAAGGNTDAMLGLGRKAMADKAWVQAQEWFRSGAIFGNDYAAMSLAYLYAQGHEGLDGDGARAVKIFQSVDTPVARRALALMYLEGEGVPKDPAKAIPVLRQDAERGDSESSLMLGLGWLEGRFGKVDETEAMRWLKKGLDAGDGDTVNGYATHLYYENADTASRKRAVAMWRQNLPLTKNTGVGNNLAWALCTSPDDAVRDGAEGLVVAKSLGKVDELESGTVDTLASCHAAVSEFDEAARLQALAIERLEAFSQDDESLAGMRERLALYRARKPFIETKRAE